MTLITQLSRLTDLAYDAAEGGSWESFLAATASVFDVEQANLMTDVPDSGSGRPLGQEHSWGALPSSWYPDPSNDQLMERTWRLPRGRIAVIQRLAESNEHALSEHYRTFLVEARLNHLVLALVPQTRGRVAFFSLVRTVDQAPFSAEEIEAIEGLIPHMRRALRLAGERSAPPRKNLFEHSPYGLVLLDEEGQSLAVNDLAGELLTNGDGIWSLGSSVNIAGVRDFPAFVASLLESGPDFAPAVLRIERRKAEQPLAAIVAPAPAEWSQVGGRPAAAVLVLGDPEQSNSPEADVLVAHYGLTRSEARLAVMLVETRTLKAAAARLGIAAETARHHIKSVFHKTRTHSQAELVRLLVRHPTALFTPLGGSRPSILLSAKS